MSSSADTFVPLCDFLKIASLSKITISRIFTQQWKLHKIQSKEEDCKYFINLLREVENEIVDSLHKEHIGLLQDSVRIHYAYDELISLLDTGELRGNFKGNTNWKDMASNNIAILKNMIKSEKTYAHKHVFTKISNVRVEDLSQDDPLYLGVIDLSSDKFKIAENQYSDLAEGRVSIRELNKSADIKEICEDFVARRDEIQRLRKFVISPDEQVSHKNSLVKTIARLIDTTMYRFPMNYEVEITRSERQSIASKNRKIQEQKGSRGNKPDLMIRVIFRNKWEEIVYFESGKWSCSGNKIRSDRNKLVQFCIDGSDELTKICKKESLNKSYMGFGINIA
ncbi:9389_t:CDS:2, partial [Diversispora eburnea]